MTPQTPRTVTPWAAYTMSRPQLLPHYVARQVNAEHWEQLHKQTGERARFESISEATNAAREANRRQREADRVHHLDRLQWLSSQSPRYACGAPVKPSEKAQMMTASRQALELIENHHMTLNHARREP